MLLTLDITTQRATCNFIASLIRYFMPLATLLTLLAWDDMNIPKMQVTILFRSAVGSFRPVTQQRYSLEKPTSIPFS